MRENNDIPLRNYFILAFILILSIILIIYFYMWYGAYEENRLNTPIMDSYLSVINYNELDNFLVENKDAVIYISVLHDDDIRVFEKKFKNVIEKNSLNKAILYLDLTCLEENNSDFNNFMIRYKLKDLPSIVVFKDGIVYDVYNIKANGSDINSLTSYLILEGVIDD